MSYRQQQLSQAYVQCFEDLVRRFQLASESLERSYAELQERARTLSEQLEQEREKTIRLERLAAMGEMAMELAHEIRNPLGSIELYASMLDGEYAQQIVQGVRLLNHCVTNVLQFGKPITPKLETLSPGILLKAVRTFLEPVALQKCIRIETRCGADCTVVGDYELLYRMLLNLVLNALRETPKEGRILIRAKSVGAATRFTVEDTGPGIARDKLAKIFDPMFSTRRDGCGLGLPIVKRIVESHDGTLRVTSGKNGTKFSIWLKASEN